MPGLKTLAETCVPREEVLSGELRDEMFAARLNDVVQGKAHPVYQDPEQFFANTYPTERMRSFLNEVMGRLSRSDKTASALFRLDTPFGGGKTHALIALYHAARSRLSEATLNRLGLRREVIPSDGVAVVSVVGNDLDPANGVGKEPGVHVHHLWGEIAYQLGGAGGYELVKASDQEGAAPGPQFLEKLAGDRPVLFLIDEPAAYMRVMGEKAGQLPAFLKTLTEWVTTSASRSVLVLTLAWDPNVKMPTGDAFPEETRQLAESAFSEVTSVVSRPARVVTPAQPHDIGPILRQRLFQSVDMDVAAAVAASYSDALQRVAEHGTQLPVAAVQASYRDTIQRSYPFHPTFIDVLDGKVATIPNFQRTRGALRLLARVVRRMWQRGQADQYLIHPFSVDLSDPDIVDEIAGRLDRPAYRSVVTYDVASEDSRSHAQTIDRERFSGHPLYAQYVATTILLHSLVEPPARGIDLDELLLSTITPGCDIAHLQKALQYLQEEAWHLDFEGPRYFFKTEPSLNKIVLDETNSVPLHEARNEVTRRVRQIWQNAAVKVECFPDDPSQLDDESTGRLVVMHWDTASFRPPDKSPPSIIRELWEYAGVQRSFRTRRNTVFFLVADPDRRDRMLEQARRWLALDRLLRDSTRLEAYKLSREHRQRLDAWRKDANLQARIAITRAYCHLFYPVGDADSAFKPFAHYNLLVEDQGDVRVNLTETVLARLRELGKVKAADDAPLAASWVKQNVFGRDEGSIDLRALFERFAERVRLPLLLEPTYLKEIVRLGMKQGEWLYYDRAANMAYDNEQDLPDIVLDNQHELMLPVEARARNVPIFHKEKEEKRKKEEKVSEERVLEGVEAELHVEGEPRRVLEDLRAQAKDNAWTAIGILNLRWQASGADVQSRLSALQTLIGQLSGHEIAVDVSTAHAFEDGSSWEGSFKGPAQRYTSVLASALASLSGQASDGHASVGVSVEFLKGLRLDGAEYDDVRDALELANPGRLLVRATRFQEKAE